MPHAVRHFCLGHGGRSASDCNAGFIARKDGQRVARMQRSEIRVMPLQITFSRPKARPIKD
jgi:hypothetical protein